MGIAAKGPSGSEILELSDGQSAGVSGASTVRIRANAATGQAEVSAFGAAYAAIGGGGSVDLPPDDITYSFVNNLSGSGTASMGSAASFTLAVSFMPLRERIVTGVRFWCNLSAPVDFKASLWESNAGSRVADGTSSVASGEGVYDVLFSTPYTLLSSDIGQEFRISLYHLTGTAYPRAISSGGFMPSIPFVANTYVQSSYNLFGTGDSYPGSVAGSDLYIIEPIFQKVTA